MVDDTQAFIIFCFAVILTIPISAIIMTISPTGQTALAVVVGSCSFMLIAAIIFIKKYEL